MLQGSRFPEFWLFPHDRLRGTALIKAGSEGRAPMVSGFARFGTISSFVVLTVTQPAAVELL
jgi:hypothetical protein